MIQSALHSLDPERRTMLLQLVRYALAGLAITLAVAGSYWAITDLLHVDPMVSSPSCSCLFRRQLRHPRRI